MQPDGFRNHWRFVGCSSAALTLLSAAPALAAPYSANMVFGTAPLTIALGAAAFAVLTLLAFRNLVRDGKAARAQAGEQISGLRAQVDEYEALLSASREVTVLWSEHATGPRILGQVSAILPPGRRAESVLDFAYWLADADAAQLGRAIEGLRVHGQGFSLNLKARDSRPIRASGWVLGGGAALRLRPKSAIADLGAAPDLTSVRAMLSAFVMPAFLRDADGELIYANPAYQRLAGKLGKQGDAANPAELLEPAVLKRHLQALAATDKAQNLGLTFPAAGPYDLTEFSLAGGTAGYFCAKAEIAAPTQESRPSRTAALVEALAIPVAIFDAKRELVAFNRAYAGLWKLDGNWLRPGLDERTILDRLRTAGALPTEPDYQGWRARHLTSYGLTTKRQLDPWHLPDGRTLNVTAAPAGPEGGVIYLFEDISRELALVSQNKALANVQRSTLNALSEGVAVFGTNGRLQLFNPRLSTLWKLPTNFLEQNPHIDQVAETVAKALPEDGATIWRDLKREIIDLNPTRSDTSGRLSRADGRLLDYAVVRLPDGQRLMTFLDVTESANFQRVLGERNDALITADRLKDAFVQNVSYELRSPLTNIIGFSDLLASPDVGPLTDRQRAYTDYIRASSVTLGVLIDNILDLATVDAGIAELRPEPQDVATLVEKARAGLAATFPEINGGTSVNLKVEIDDDLPPFIADGTRIVQVLYNLLSSAARFSEPGGEVRLIVSARGERMLFIVEDEGAAMSDEMKAAILDRVDNATNTGRQRGAGLGLAIVRTFVNLHGGTISVEELKPRGSRVVVNLPRDASAVSTAAE
jgi:signal transduction histidine kinase